MNRGRRRGSNRENPRFTSNGIFADEKRRSFERTLVCASSATSSVLLERVFGLRNFFRCCFPLSTATGILHLAQLFLVLRDLIFAYLFQGRTLLLPVLHLRVKPTSGHGYLLTIHFNRLDADFFSIRSFYSFRLVRLV